MVRDKLVERLVGMLRDDEYLSDDALFQAAGARHTPEAWCSALEQARARVLSPEPRRKRKNGHGRV